MDFVQRTNLRHALMLSALSRVSSTPDDGDGTYSEVWRHPDGTLVTVSWGTLDERFPDAEMPEIFVCSDCERAIPGSDFTMRGNARLCGHCAHCPSGSDCADPACPYANPLPRVSR